MDERHKEYVLVIVLSAATLFLSLLLFPRTTPDSAYYLTVVDIFKGNQPFIMAAPPYCYRLLMPFIVALFPTDPLLTWATINVMMNVFIVPVTYLIIREFDISPVGAFVGTGLTTVGVMSIMWGPWVGTDVPALLFMALAFLGIVRGSRGELITGALLIGTLFKEFVILGAVVWVVYSSIYLNGKHAASGVIATTITVFAYLLVRAFWTHQGITGAWLWSWNDFGNFIIQPEGVIKTFVLGLMFWTPVLIAALIIGIRERPRQFRSTWCWLVACIPLLGYLFMGLFMAYFDLRFIWPLYLAMAPLGGLFGDWLWSNTVVTLQKILPSGKESKVIQDG